MTKWVIAGLGNPGAQYEKTRHNVGFMAIHALASSQGLVPKSEKQFNALVANGTFRFEGESHPVVLVQPLTYMNLSGESLSKILHYYKVEPENLLVIYDDTALPFGKIRIRAEGSAGGHNGMKSIIQMLGGNQVFPRLRIGIGPPAHSLHDHVLSKFTAEEEKGLIDILKVSEQAVAQILSKGALVCMTHFNGLEIIKPLKVVDPPSP
ncbi:MAG: aminoacyl-tRNA hydrolase [Cyanobacteria bacterium]|nr:aminoacyl-tRNA hydrolase [Cyanobacteriota bacterium]